MRLAAKRMLGGIYALARSWTIRSTSLCGSTGNNIFRCAGFGNGRFLATTTSNVTFYSDDDGESWNVITSQAAYTGFSYGAGRWVAVGTNLISTSIDGIIWTTVISSTASWTSIVYAGGQFVAVASSGTNRVGTSFDGLSWTLRNASAANTWTSVTYGNGIYIAVASSGTVGVMGSSDGGITWTGQSATTGYLFVTFGNGLFVASLSNGTIATSTAGTSWTTVYSSPPNYTPRGLAYNGNIFVSTYTSLVGNNAVIPSSSVIYSPDGTTWLIGNYDVDGAYGALAYTNGIFLSFSITQPSNSLMASSDGNTWLVKSAPRSAQIWSDVVAGKDSVGNERLLAISSIGTDIPFMNSDDGGVTWESSYVISQSSFNNICFGNGVYIAIKASHTQNVGQGDRGSTDDGSIAISSDGVNWYPVVTGYNTTWKGVCFGNGLFVVVSNDKNGCIMTSPNGVTWALRDSPKTTLWSVTYGNGLFVAAGGSGTGDNSVVTSTDGITWTLQVWSFILGPGTGDGIVNGIAYGNGVYVLMGTTVNFTGSIWELHYATSNDAITWVHRTTTIGGGLLEPHYLIFSNGRFMACGNAISAGAPLYVMTSSDGINWSFSPVPADTFSPRYELGSGTGGAYGTQSIASNGIGTVVVLCGRSAVDNHFSVRIITSITNGLSFFSVTIPTGVPASGPGVLFASVTYGNGQFVVISRAGYVITSSDGINWTLQAYLGPAQQWLCVAHDGNSRWVAISNIGNALISNTGDIWVPRLTSALNSTSADWSIIYGTKFVAVSSSNITMTSPEGEIWSNVPTPISSGWRSITYGNGTYVAVANTGTPRVMTSSDGVNWTGRTVVANLWSSVAYGNGIFVAVATGGQVMRSIDNGITWTLGIAAAANLWTSITFGAGVFIAVSSTGGNTSRAMASVDGVTWIMDVSATADQPSTSIPGVWLGVAYSNGKFVAVANSVTSSNSLNKAMTRN